jgi:hypothetical protein
LTVSLSKITLGPTPAAVKLSLDAGPEAGSREDPWTAGKGGVLRYP